MTNTRSALLIAATGLAACMTAPPSEPVPPIEPSPRATPTPAPRIDQATNDVARILAGLPPADTARFEKLLATKAWKSHEAAFRTSWEAFDKRAKTMTDWRDTELAPLSRAGGTLFYPFSGPDILNAYLLFPRSDSYVFLSLERVGTLPNLEVPEKRLAAVFDDLNAALASIFKRNYFITKSMNADLRTPHLEGNLALFLVFLARTGNDIVGMRDVQVGTNGVIADRVKDAKAPAGDAPRPLPGIEIRFTHGGGAVKTLHYFAVDVSNGSLAKKPHVMQWLRAMPHVTTFTKAASYLMHGSDFSVLRELCLEQSELVVDDDSGIPYRFFKPEKWTVQLYGKYTKPIKDFGYGFQPDLDRAYQQPGIKPLPFRFGYHWFDEYSNVLVAVRKAPAS